MVLFDSLLIFISASIKIFLLICLVPSVDNTRTIAQAAGWKESSNEPIEDKIFEGDSYHHKFTSSWRQELRSDQDEIISSDMEGVLSRALTKSWEQKLDKVRMSSRTLLTTQELAYHSTATKDTISQYSESQTSSKQCECISNVEKRSVTEFSENKDVTVRKPPLNIALLLPTLKMSALNTTKFPKYQFAKAYVKPAVVIALKTTPIFQNYEVNIIDIDTQVLADVTVNQMFNAKMTYGNIHLYLGPVSDYCISVSAKQLRYWNEPIITPGGLASDFSAYRTKYFPTLTLIGAQSGTQTLVTATGAIFDQFKFRRTLLVYEDTYEGEEVDNQCFFVIKAYYTMIRRITNVYEFDHWKLDENSKHYINKLLHQEIANKFAVIIMCASPTSVRDIMLEAHKLKFTNGEYIFFNIDLFGSKAKLEQPWYDEKSDDNEVAREAFQSLMTITLKKPNDEKYRNFSMEVKKRAKEEQNDPNFEYGEDEVNSFVGAFHDAVLLYALALNETVNITDGKEVTERMWNRTFEGITGNVSIDDNGDRNADYSLLNYNRDTQKFDVAGNYLGSSKEYQKVREIHWPGGRTEPPPDKPVCGYDNSGCPEKGPPQPWIISTAVFSAVLVVLVVGGFFVYRRYKYENELNKMTWRIRSQDIIFAGRRGGGSIANKAPGARGTDGVLTRRDSRISCISRFSVDSVGVMEHGILGKQQLFTQTGFYKSDIVALKSTPVKSVTENRDFLKEIKSRKDLQHDHIVRFIGICLDPGNEYIVTEYCQKGSLQDILENDQIQLDAMFKHSLIQDIAKGMEYLHGSGIGCHGNLKSTNCVVDSRFVLKLTDFGLKSLRNSGQKRSLEEEDKYQICKRKLWTAPELIVMTDEPSAQAYQKGDVYSFAIICQEVIYRLGVFHIENDDNMSPEDIIGTLQANPAFRPTLHNADCDITAEAKFIKRCWAVEPLDRPDFTLIKNSYRRFMKHSDAKGGNLVDNLLSRMEQYANNLESLVEERTADYLEEKKRAEDLLYMMLPKSIASILIKGENVAAEWFDEVTIYFSDICGFTALSAESSPMQVVALLNDLYTAFDNIIEEFDVYKVETIGDAYMVVSGLPNKNGINHAREIARMSLKLLDFIKTFKIRHKPEERIKLRIGMHSGPVCAGVVGLKMPRYCLFGDTVNTASRMESNGLPLKIHVSPLTKEILDKFGYFNLELRGTVEMKGKGLVTTYWLLGDNSPPPVKPTAQAPANNATSCNGTHPPVTTSLPPIRGGSKGAPYRRRPSLVPSIPEEDSLSVQNSSNNDLSKSPPIAYQQLGTRSNNNEKEKVTKTTSFKDLEMDTARMPLLNGHGDGDVDIERLTKV